MRTLTSVAVALILCVSACVSIRSALTLNGDFLGQRLETPVDAPIASYYVESYLAGVRKNIAWDAALDAIHHSLGERIPSANELREWSSRYSTDLAALVLARQLLRQADGHPFNRLFRAEVSSALSAERRGELDTFVIDPEFLILFVPGWLYKTDPETGADFARFRTLLARHRARVTLADVGENLSVEENAKLLEMQIRDLAATGQRIILVSGSKGGPEVAVALSNLCADPASRHVKAWVNIGGLLKGTPLADLGTTWPVSWFAYLWVLPDHSFAGLRSLSTTRSSARLGDLKLPPGVTVVNYVGIPLSGQVSDQARRGYRQLVSEGPNDGLTYVVDAIAPSGVTIPELGADHYFHNPDIEIKTLALARALTQYVRQPGTPALRAGAQQARCEAE